MLTQKSKDAIISLFGKYLLPKLQEFIDMDQNQNENLWDEEYDYDSDADMVPAEEPETAYEEGNGGTKVRVAGWRVLSVIFLLLGVGGLFLGMLSQVLDLFMPVEMFFTIDGFAGLEGSLFNYVVAYVQNLMNNFSSFLEGGVAGILSNVVGLLSRGSPRRSSFP